jgi:antitoxin component YwqK of YwqJK toxin-antitoxin module
MGKYTLNLVFILTTFFCHSQINQIDKNGKKQGEWRKNYPQSKAFEYVGQFKDDQPIGTFYYYYPSTKKKAIVKHDNKTKRSEAIMFHESGVILASGIYRNQSKDSVWSYYGPSGRLSYKETFKNGKLHGLKTIFFIPEDPNDKSQQIARIENYKDSILDGEYKEFFDFGNVKYLGNYIKGKKHGKHTSYHINGKPMFIELYKEGIKHGWSIGYSEAGAETGRRYYLKGRELVDKELNLYIKHCKEKGINMNE